MLLKAHADVNVPDRTGVTALIKVCNSPTGSEDLMNLLIQSGAKIDMQETSRGMTALLYATERGHSNIIQLLLNEEAAVNTQESTGLTALMFMCHYNHPDIVQLLLSYGADPNIQDHSVYSALMFACLRQLTLAVELLLAHGADPNLQNEAGWTAVIYSCDQINSTNDPSIPVLLLSAGANPNAASFNGYTALMLAAGYGYHAGVEALLNANADINVGNTFYGATALHFVA